MIISELNMLLLAKCEMYNIDGFTKSNIDTFIKLIALYRCIKLLYCINGLYVHVYILCVLYIITYCVLFCV